METCLYHNHLSNLCLLHLHLPLLSVHHLYGCYLVQYIIFTAATLNSHSAAFCHVDARAVVAGDSVASSKHMNSRVAIRDIYSRTVANIDVGIFQINGWISSSDIDASPTLIFIVCTYPGVMSTSVVSFACTKFLPSLLTRKVLAASKCPSSRLASQ